MQGDDSAVGCNCVTCRHVDGIEDAGIFGLRLESASTCEVGQDQTHL